MRRPACLLVGFALFFGAASEATVSAAPSSKELKALQGVWVLGALEADGGKIEGFEGPNAIQLYIDGDKYSSQVGSNVIEQGTLSLDASKGTAWIDLMPSTGERKGQVVSGIYVLRGDSLVLCLVPAPAARPNEFEAHKGDGRIVAIYKRLKSR